MTFIANNFIPTLRMKKRHKGEDGALKIAVKPSWTLGLMNRINVALGNGIRESLNQILFTTHTLGARSLKSLTCM